MMDIPADLDLSLLVHKNRSDYVCNKCHVVLVRIEKDGIFGQDLNGLDLLVIVNHYKKDHDPMRPVTLNPDTVWGP